jgi:hypothetical protein
MHCSPQRCEGITVRCRLAVLKRGSHVYGFWRVRSSVDGYRTLLCNSTRSGVLFAEVPKIQFGPGLFVLYFPGSLTPPDAAATSSERNGPLTGGTENPRHPRICIAAARSTPPAKIE